MREVTVAGQEESLRKNDSHRSRDSRPAKIPLIENGFTPIPRAFDDLAIALGRLPEGRQMARVLPLVFMDLARFTDTRHGDVVVTNDGIAERRGVGLPAVKSTIKLLIERCVVRKTEPALGRFAELKRLPGGFSRNRRYLVWNPQSKWRLPQTSAGLAALVAVWTQYLGKADVPKRNGYR